MGWCVQTVCHHGQLYDRSVGRVGFPAVGLVTTPMGDGKSRILAKSSVPWFMGLIVSMGSVCVWHRMQFKSAWIELGSSHSQFYQLDHCDLQTWCIVWRCLNYLSYSLWYSRLIIWSDHGKTRNATSKCPLRINIMYKNECHPSSITHTLFVMRLYITCDQLYYSWGKIRKRAVNINK